MRKEYRLPSTVMGILGVALLIFFLATPIIRVVYQSFSYQENDALLANVPEGTLTGEFYRETLASRIASKLLYAPLWHSVVTGGLATLFAVLLGGGTAFLLVRTDLPWRGLLRSIVLVPYIMPPWPIALAWIAFFESDARVGGSVGILQWLTGIAPPEWLCYGPFPLIAVEAIHLYPYACMLISAALVRVDARLEEAALVHGLSRLKTIAFITLPLTLPALLSTAVLAFGKASGTFSTAYFVGNPARYFTLSTRLYEQAQQGNVGRAAILAMALMALSAVTLLLNRRLLAGAARFGAVSGKGFRIRRMPLGRFRTSAFLLLALLVIGTVAAPMAILLYQSVSGVDGTFAASNLTLHYWTGKSDPAFAGGEPGILRSRAMWQACLNSTRLALTASALCVFLALPLALAVRNRRRPLFAGTIEILTFLPYMTPSLAFGAAYLLMFARPLPLLPPLYGTFALLVLVSVAKEIPYAVRIEAAALDQVGGELLDAARILGVRGLLLFRKILAPLLKPSIVAAFVMMLIGVMKELSLVILLVGPNTEILTTYVYRYQELGHRGFSAALVVFLVALVLLLSLAAKLAGRDRLAEG